MARNLAGRFRLAASDANFSQLINVRALTDARSRSGVNGEAELFARPVKPFGRGRPRLRRMRAVMQIQLRGRARIEIWRGCAAELGPSQRQAKRRLEQESPANTVVEETCREICLLGRQRGTERAETRRVSELGIAVSCRSGDLWWRAK